jgi:nucleoside-diphosphate-sugar epimerase
LARTPEAAAKLRSAGSHPVLGHLGDLPAWEGQLKGCDVLIHAAAPMEFWGPWSRFQRDIVDATVALLAAAGRQGVGRFVHVSSESVLQDEADLLDIDERHPYPATPNSFYGKAKKLAEEGILAAKTPVSRVIIRPTFIWGQGCPAMDQVVAKVRSGAFVWIDGGQAPMEAVHVCNTAAAIVLACRRGVDGGVYLITDDERATVRDFFTSYLSALGVEAPKKQLPGWFAKRAAAAVETAWRVLHLPGTPPMTRFDLAFVSMGRRYDISRAKRELGYRPLIARSAGFNDVRARRVKGS